MVRWLAFLVALAVPCAAAAEWREAVTRHFVVYSGGSEAELREAARELETYDFLLRQVIDVPKDDPIKLKIYLMRDIKAVQETLGYGIGGTVAGYYVAAPRGPIAVGTRDDGDLGWDMSSRTVLFHEYAHHLMLQHFAATYPQWYVEGFAEFFGVTKILPGNVVEIGHPARHRAYALNDGGWIPLKTLLTARTWKDIDGKYWLLYGQGWLLTHYLYNNKERATQLRQFLADINNGVDRKTAMDAAFGKDAEELDRELRAYMRRNRFEGTRATFASIDTGPIDIRLLRPAEEELIRHEIALGRGVFARHAERFATDVRRIAARFPNDPHALAVLAEAEHLAGQQEAAAAAADRWLQIEPEAPRALALRSRIAAQALAASASKDAKAWDAARKWVAQARAKAPQDPFVLEAFYDSYAAQGILPPARAQNALYRAMELVPQDDQLRYKVAADFEQRGLFEAAILAISPAAYGAHEPEQEKEKDKAKREKAEEKWRKAGMERTESAREMLARLQQKFAEASAQKPPAQTASNP